MVSILRSKSFDSFCDSMIDFMQICLITLLNSTLFAFKCTRRLLWFNKSNSDSFELPVLPISAQFWTSHSITYITFGIFWVRVKRCSFWRIIDVCYVFFGLAARFFFHFGVQFMFQETAILKAEGGRNLTIIPDLPDNF